MFVPELIREEKESVLILHGLKGILQVVQQTGFQPLTARHSLPEPADLQEVPITGLLQQSGLTADQRNNELKAPGLQDLSANRLRGQKADRQKDNSRHRRRHHLRRDLNRAVAADHHVQGADNCLIIVR